MGSTFHFYFHFLEMFPSSPAISSFAHRLRVHCLIFTYCGFPSFSIDFYLLPSLPQNNTLHYFSLYKIVKLALCPNMWLSKIVLQEYSVAERSNPLESVSSSWLTVLFLSCFYRTSGCYVHYKRVGIKSPGITEQLLLLNYDNVCSIYLGALMPITSLYL